MRESISVGNYTLEVTMKLIVADGLESRDYLHGVEVVTARTAAGRLDMSSTSVRQYLNKPGAPKPYATGMHGQKQRLFWKAEEALPYLDALNRARLAGLARGERLTGRPRKAAD